MEQSPSSPERPEESVRVVVLADGALAAERLASDLRKRGISVATYVGSSDDEVPDWWAKLADKGGAGALAAFLALTVREQAVLAWLMEGLSADAIARKSWVSVSTVRSQIKSILRKLDVTSQVAAVALAYRAGWRPVDGAAEA